jgi:hypothetical protein
VKRRAVGPAALAAVALAFLAACSSDPSPAAPAAPAAAVAGTTGESLTPGSTGAAAVPSSTAPACAARVLGIGDSIAAQSIGPATDHLRDMGLATYLDARWGTGPLDHDPDWVAVARQLEDAFHPTVVLALFYGNYAQQIAGVPPDSPEEYARWGERVAEMTRTFTDAGAQVVWLQPPPRPEGTVSPTWGATAAAVSAIPGVTLRPTGDLVAGPDGRWAPELRDPDRIHLTKEGGDRMAADAVTAALEAAGCPAPAVRAGA